MSTRETYSTRIRYQNQNVINVNDKRLTLKQESRFRNIIAFFSLKPYL